MATRPVICVAPNWQLLKPGSVHAPNETVPSVFMDAILAAGGLPVMMPTADDEGIIRHFVTACDGFAIPGGPNVDPQLWGERQLGGWPCPERDRLELPLIRMVAKADKPLLGICRGMQVMNVWAGGSLVQNVGDLDGPAVDDEVGWHDGSVLDRHRQTPQALAHDVDVAEGTLLGRIVGAGTHRVNSHHRMAVRRLGTGLVASARAADGIVEAIELPGKRFFLGLQWHPEYTYTFNEPDRLIWRAFVEAAGAR